MAKTELVLPAMGEGIIEATIIKWLVNEGDLVEEDQPLLEIATDKVDSEIPSPVKGVITKIIVPEGGVPSIGDKLAEIDAGPGDLDESAKSGQGIDVTRQTEEVSRQPHQSDITAFKSGSKKSSSGDIISKSDDNHKEKETFPEEGITRHHISGLPRQTPSGKFLTPLVRNIAIKEEISLDELDSIEGSGDEGRINKEDVLKFLQTRKKVPDSGTEPGTSPAGEGNIKETGGSMDQVPGFKEGEPQEKTAETDKSVLQKEPSPEGNKTIEMGRMRKLISDHMVNSKRISAHVTSFIDADVTGIVHWREASKSEFLKRENQKITYTPVFIEAVAKALRDYPMINVSVDENTIIMKKNINIGMAVALSEGNLIVPVIKNADEKSLTGLARAVNDLANRARENKLLPGEVTGGTFTITNFGTFRNTTGTPIINQPEVAILGTGAIIKKPVVVETSMGDVIAVRSMMTLSLSYDHRVVDGALGGMFLRRVAGYLEDFDTERKI